VPALVKGRFVFQPHCNTGLYNMQPSGHINYSETDDYNACLIPKRLLQTY